MSLLALQLDTATAGHLAVAIRQHRRALKRAGHPCPTGLRQLEVLATEAANTRQPQTQTDSAIDRGGERAYGHPNGSRLLTHKQAAQQLGVCERSVARMLDRGDLGHVLVAGRRRVTQAAINELRPAAPEATVNGAGRNVPTGDQPPTTQPGEPTRV